MSIETITSPLPGERVVGLSPGDAGEASLTWLRRPNLFPGRALTAASLQQRQQWQAGRMVERASTWVAGIDDGLELQVSLTGEAGPAGVRLTLSKGLGLAASGEDVVLQRPLSCSLADVPVVAPASFFIDGTGVGNSGPGGVLLPRAIGATLRNLTGPARAALPALGVLVLQPVLVDTANLDPLDPCDRSAFDEGTAEDPTAFEDWRVGDGVRLLWYVWPGEWRAVNASAAQLRNVAAWTVFQAEAALPRDDAVPWDAFGLPVALAALDIDNDLRPLWVDRASVARRGGRARDARLRSVGTAVAADPRLPSLWQARIEQFAEQVAAMDGATPAELAAAFERHLPPVGLLPKDCFVPLSQHSGFFPPLFDLDAAPVPVEQLDLAVRASAGLAPLDLTQAESVRLLVPVPLAHWEPRLLIREVVDPEFQRTLDRYLLTRSRELGARQGLRHKAAMLSHALDGQVQTVPGYKDDPAATEPESLKPWGEPPPGGGHRSALMAGLHQHYFDGATPTFEVLAGESLFVWACLDPDHPPRTLMLQWHSVSGTGAGSWEHRAYWGEDSIAMGAPDGSAAHLRMGDLPTAGAWVMLTVPAASLGLAGQQVDGMAFTLQDGRAAFGLAGARTANDWRKWFCNFLPLGARAQGNEPWDLLTANDLWVPFDPHDGVVPSLPEIVVAAAGGVIPGEGEGASTYRAVPTSGFNVRYAPADGWRGHANIFTAPHDVNLPTVDADRLNAWLYLDELTPPRSIIAYVVCRAVNTTTGVPTGGSQVNIFFWGENRFAELAKASATFGQLASVARQVGPLPQSGTWTELQIPIAEQGETRTGRVRVLAALFLAFGGDLAFSDLFIRRGLPAEEPPPPELLWPTSFSGDVTVPPVMPFLNARLVFQNNLGVLTPTPSSRIGTVRTYTELIRDPLIQRLSAHEQSQLLLRGLSGFADYLRRRIDRADDITDFGFAHMQVDIHRIRQLMMSTSDAARLAVSPALAAIAKSDSALVVQGQISEYIDKVRASAATPRAGVLQAVSAAAASSFSSGAAAGGFSATATATASVQASAGVLKAAGIATQAKLITPPRAPLNIVYAQPVIGLSEIRTVAIADRLRQPPSTEARDYALANRHRTVRSLLDLLENFMAEDSGSAPSMLADFDIFGLPGDPFLVGANEPRRKLTEFRNNPALLEQLRSPPPLSTTTVDEAGLFTQTVALSDSTIAILRQLEARLIAYRDALNRCDTALAGLLDDITGTNGRLAAVEDALAEARHDVSVARALLAEETVRIAGINTRRTRVLDEEVKFIAYVRPRECDNLRATPTHAVDPALVEAPVPACLREHPDLDEDLLEMLRVVREAPAAWFVKMPALVRKLDRVEHLQRSLQTAKARMLAGLSVPRPVAVPQGAARLRQAISRVAVRQAEALAPRVAALQALDLNLFAGATWKTVQVQAQQVLSFGDLADGAHGRSDVAQAAAGELHGIRSIVACLHAEFCGVMPALRLAWAETLSEFDEAPSLRNLGSLARWSEIDSVDRRQMQAYVDWLFGQVEPGQPQAVALVNDVVRMCLLLASHAPVDRIISGRLARPVTGVSPGIRIPLTVLDARRLRVGMQAVLYRADTVVARAVVEDLGQQEVSAHVIHTSATRVDLGDDVRVHFDDEAMLSLGAASAKRSLFGR